MSKDYLYGWLFTYNPHTDKWAATQNDNMFALFNGHNDKVLVSSSIDTLITLITRTNGEAKKIKKLVK